MTPFRLPPERRNLSGAPFSHDFCPVLQRERLECHHGPPFLRGDEISRRSRSAGPTPPPAEPPSCRRSITKLNKEGTVLTKAKAAVDIFTRNQGPHAASGKSETVLLSAPSKPMTLWDKVWMLAAGAGVVIMVLFALLFRYQEKPPQEAKPAA